jgi:hypothetical protein
VVTCASLQPTFRGRYLLMTAKGAPAWVDDPSLATAFESMRDATRAAMRLPASVKAYGMPREVEIRARQMVH